MHRSLPTVSRLAGVIAALALSASIAGCSSDAGDPISRATGAGEFIASYEPTTSAETGYEAELLQRNAVLESFVAEMNSFVALPSDVEVIATECGVANAYYDPTAHTIQLCYELAVSERQLFAEIGDSGDVLDTEIIESATATLYHEAGHALIAELELKATGREEDVADQLAAYMLTSDPDSTSTLITVANTYGLSADKVTSLDELPFYDTHSLDAQRATTFLCYAFGAFPDEFQYLIAAGALDEDRGAGCEDEFSQMAAAWEALLAPHLK
jgi:hypothetical protein